MRKREVLRLFGAVAVTSLLSPLRAQATSKLAREAHVRVGNLAVVPPNSVSTYSGLISALADTILPRTDSPGALDVGVPEFVQLLVAEWYSDDDRQSLLTGLEAFELQCRADRQMSFMQLDAAGRIAFLTSVEGQRDPASTASVSYGKLKEIIVFGYVTSPAVGPGLSPYPIVPGRFDGCIHVTDGRTS